MRVFGFLASEREQYQSLEQECLQQSYAEFGLPENGAVHLPDDSPISDYLEQAWEATESDPRLADVTAAWSTCMSGQGYDIDAVYAEIHDEHMARLTAS